MAATAATVMMMKAFRFCMMILVGKCLNEAIAAAKCRRTLPALGSCVTLCGGAGG
jgi:hypothetical protein